MHVFEEEDRFNITTRGLVITTRLPRDFTPLEFKELTGSNVEVDGVIYLVKAVEYVHHFIAKAHGKYAKGKDIGLLVKPV